MGTPREERQFFEALAVLVRRMAMFTCLKRNTECLLFVGVMVLFFWKGKRIHWLAGSLRNEQHRFVFCGLLEDSDSAVLHSRRLKTRTCGEVCFCSCRFG